MSHILQFPRAVPIRTADGALVQDFTTPPDWRDVKKATGAALVPVDLAVILAEEHHRAYGRPWVIGRCYFDELIARHVRPTDRVLDLGCGAGRVGIWLIPFLERAHYYGVEDRLGTLVAFAAYECVLHDLLAKEPNLLLDDELVDRSEVEYALLKDWPCDFAAKDRWHEYRFRK